jgi:hypothetical protein
VLDVGGSKLNSTQLSFQRSTSNAQLSIFSLLTSDLPLTPPLSPRGGPSREAWRGAREGSLSPSGSVRRMASTRRPAPLISPTVSHLFATRSSPSKMLKLQSGGCHPRLTSDTPRCASQQSPARTSSHASSISRTGPNIPESPSGRSSRRGGGCTWLWAATEAWQYIFMSQVRHENVLPCP